MKYILIILGYYGYATAEFESKASCEIAASAITKIMDVQNTTVSFRHAFCVPKGDVNEHR